MRIVEGAEVKSSQLSFKPTTIEGAHTSRSAARAARCSCCKRCCLRSCTDDLLQPPFLEGGTHNSLAPPFDFFERALIPQLAKMGAPVEASLERHGFLPAGGGKLTVTIAQASAPVAFDLRERGELKSKQLRALVAGLPYNIAQRELSSAATLLGWGPETFRPVTLKQNEGPGNMLFAQLDFEHVTEIVSRAGERGFSAEKVADEVAAQVKTYLATDAPVGPFLADQLIVPMALGAGGVFRTGELDAHTHTQIDLVRRFLPAKIAIVNEPGGVHRIEIETK